LKSVVDINGGAANVLASRLGANITDTSNALATLKILYETRQRRSVLGKTAILVIWPASRPWS
jgi:hypothetical protein